ncbi:MAG: DNA methylase [Oscillospiraceae bacterium]|nr:DNA methylase [Oscillospiraceae bacterium]
MSGRTYLCIDLKSFYASVECIERGLDPMKAHLVVADASRTEKTICLAVTPALKAHGVSGRARLFEVVQRVNEINARRLKRIIGGKFAGTAMNSEELFAHPDYELGYLAAPPRMALYMDYSTRIYDIYLRHIAPEDIHVYSVDEVFIDLTRYLVPSGLTPREFAKMMIKEVLEATGITAAAGIGSNMYLAKVAMDIMAKRVAADADGVRIAELDEMSYRRELWTHRPLTDFWRVGRGYAVKLEKQGLFTMGDIARCSIGGENDYYNEELLYKLFGVNAELLIDHAWGFENCSIADVKAYRPLSNSLSSGQVLSCPYTCEKAKLIVREMTDLMSLDLVDKGLVTDQIVLTLGYDIENLSDPARRKAYTGPVTTDFYGRKVPKHAHGTANLGCHTASTKLITDAVMELFDRIADENLLVRRITIGANHVIFESDIPPAPQPEQFDLFTDYEELEHQREAEKTELEREKRRQKALLYVKKRYGKNAILKGMNFEEGATARDRNSQIGGHKA